MNVWRPLIDRSCRAAWLVLVASMLGGGGPECVAIRPLRAGPQTVSSQPVEVGSEKRAQEPVDSSKADTRQVTVIGILVTTGEGAGLDPKLTNIKNQLRKLFPSHGFKLMDVRSGRLAADDTMGCELGKGKTARVTLLEPLDSNGKVRLRCELAEEGKSVVATEVSTPPNQLFFYDRKQADGSRLLIGVGAR